MLKLLVAKELREILGSTKFAFSFAICSILLILAFSVGGRNYQVQRSAYDASVSDSFKQIASSTDWMDVRNHRIFLEPQPLASLISGVSNDIGRTIQVQTRGELASEDSRYSQEPLFAVFRLLDLEFVFTVILSLFAIMFGYDAVNGEKERGTLRQMLANPVPRHKVILGKIFGSFLGLTIPLLIPIAIGLVIVTLMGVPLAGEDWSRLGLILVGGFLYLGAILSLSVLVSSLTKRSSSSFLFLLVLWIAMVLIWPRTSVLLAGRAVDVPNIDEINTQKNVYRMQLWQEDQDKMSDFKPSPTPEGEEMDVQKFMQEFGTFMGELTDKRDAKQAVLAEELNESRTNGQIRQQRMALSIARLSPAASFSILSGNLANTSIDLQEDFLDAANEYQNAYAAFIKEKVGFAPGGIMIKIGDDEEEAPEPLDPTEMPVFDFSPRSLSSVGGSAIIDFGLLLLFNLVFFAGAYVAFLRYDVR